MPRRDAYHDVVKRALLKEGWTITHDPLVVPFGAHDLYVDLGAERVLAAQRGDEKIAVEVKVFGGQSPVASLEQALGQYMLYRAVLKEAEPERRVVLAVPMDVYEGILSSRLGKAVLDSYSLVVLVFDPEAEVIRRWIP